MARKTHWYCDRCNKEFKRDGFTHSLFIPKQISLLLYDGLRCFSSIEWELCDDCFEELMQFWDRGKKDGK